MFNDQPQATGNSGSVFVALAITFFLLAFILGTLASNVFIALNRGNTVASSGCLAVKKTVFFNVYCVNESRGFKVF